MGPHRRKTVLGGIALLLVVAVAASIWLSRGSSRETLMLSTRLSDLPALLEADGAQRRGMPPRPRPLDAVLTRARQAAGRTQRPARDLRLFRAVSIRGRQ